MLCDRVAVHGPFICSSVSIRGLLEHLTSMVRNMSREAWLTYFPEEHNEVHLKRIL